MASSPLRSSCSGWLHLARRKASRKMLKSSALSSTRRMVCRSFMNLEGMVQFKPKTAAQAGEGVHTHPSAHAFDPFLDNGQADACARILLSPQAGEKPEDLIL